MRWGITLGFLVYLGNMWEWSFGGGYVNSEGEGEFFRCEIEFFIP